MPLVHKIENPQDPAPESRYRNLAVTPEAKDALVGLASRLSETLGRRVTLSEALIFATEKVPR